MASEPIPRSGVGTNTEVEYLIKKKKTYVSIQWRRYVVHQRGSTYHVVHQCMQWFFSNFVFVLQWNLWQPPCSTTPREDRPSSQSTFGMVMASKSSGRTLTFWKRKRNSGLPGADWPPKMSVSPSESSHWMPGWRRTSLTHVPGNTHQHWGEINIIHC